MTEGRRRNGRTVPIRSSRARGITPRLWWILGGTLLALILIPSILDEMITDWMWFGSQNLAEVYTTRLWLGLGVFLGASLLGGLVCWINWRVAGRVALPNTIYPGQRQPFSPG